MGVPNPLENNWCVQSVLSGIKRIHGTPPQPCLPITVNLLLGIRSLLNLSNSFHASFWAICLTSFFGLFRKSHLLPCSGPKFCSKKQFTRRDFVPTAHGFSVHVRWSKTIQLGQRTLWVPLVAQPNSRLCPVAAIRQAFSLTPLAGLDSQVFCWYNSDTHANAVLTYKGFMLCMKQLLVKLGVPADRYGTHSFRRGGATFALESGVPLDVISIMGDWKSDALFLYLHMPFSQRLAAQRVIASHLPLH